MDHGRAVAGLRRVGRSGERGADGHSSGVAIPGIVAVVVESAVLDELLAVVAHDFADGLNTVSFVLRQSNDRSRALRWLAVDAAAPLAGALVGAALSISEENLGKLLAVYAGFFLFMGATDLLPHAHEHPSRGRVALTTLGFGLIFALSLVAAS